MIRRSAGAKPIHLREGFFIREYGAQAEQKAPLTAAEALQQARDSLFSLGVTLLELLFGFKLEAHPLRPRYVSNGQPNEYTDLCTAKKWREEAETEFGPEFAEAIRHCIDGDLGPAFNLDNSEFVDSVLTHVIEPIRNYVALYVT
ncbi:hypothetical protein BJY04DRAFT_220797 [Aspergillus karnatakaensis]|uniref:uncharacterized protein n=1 Tax=Aspergillus karnatakaensis TaxID=1810916 RepID=UPI003CCD237A